MNLSFEGSKWSNKNRKQKIVIQLWIFFIYWYRLFFSLLKIKQIYYISLSLYILYNEIVNPCLKGLVVACNGNFKTIVILFNFSGFPLWHYNFFSVSMFSLFCVFFLSFYWPMFSLSTFSPHNLKRVAQLHYKKEKIKLCQAIGKKVIIIMKKNT